MKIGFIDYYLDEWHANNYPKLFGEVSGGEITIGSAYGKIASPATGKTSAQWCGEMGIRQAETIEQVIEENDCLVVLSPDHPEMHPELTAIALASGKRTYIDKTFALTKREAEEMFANAEAHNTPCFSSSALRFANEIKAVDKTGVDYICSRGPGEFSTYAIHQVEPIVTLMGADVRRVMSIGTAGTPGLLIDYRDGRRAVMNNYGWGEGSFNLRLKYADGRVSDIANCNDYFNNFIVDLVDFFRTGDVKVSHGETIAIMAILEKGAAALRDPENWQYID